MCLEQATELDPGYVKARINKEFAAAPGRTGQARLWPLPEQMSLASSEERYHSKNFFMSQWT